MGTLRILLILTAILICCLLILPKPPKEKIWERWILKTITIICACLIISLSIVLYYFKDTLWKEQDTTALIAKKIQSNNDKTKSIILSNYDLQNFTPVIIKTILMQQPEIKTFTINELSIKNISKLQYILQNNATINTIVVKHTDNEVIINIIKLIANSNNIQAIFLTRNKLTIQVLEELVTTVKNKQNINTIGLNYTDLSDDAIPQILNLLSMPITNLALQGNQFTTASLSKLAQALQQNKTLQVLTISAGTPAENNKKLLLDAVSNTQIKIDFGN